MTKYTYSEWKEPEVKEPKFKVGDRVRPNKEEWTKNGWSEDRVYQHWNDCWRSEGAVKYGDIFYVITVDGDKIGYSNKPNGIGPTSTPARYLELVEPEITVNSRWTSNGKKRPTVTVVAVTETHVAFSYEGGTIGQTTKEKFVVDFVPYVEPPKSLVGYVGVVKAANGRFVFTDVYGSVDDLRYGWEGSDVVSVKKFEWTEGE